MVTKRSSTIPPPALPTKVKKKSKVKIKPKKKLSKPRFDPFEMAKAEIELEYIRHCNHLVMFEAGASLMKRYKLTQLSWYDNGTPANIAVADPSDPRTVGFAMGGGIETNEEIGEVGFDRKRGRSI